MIKGVKGTKDILPDEVGAWQRVEAEARKLFALYGYREIRTPIFEDTQLFARGIGAETDIVSKEMYSFQDRDESSLTLRPEATAGVVRSVIENNLMNTDPALRVYVIGPMFRRERPQKGRYRQFHQVDVETFGVAEPSIDVEVIEMALGYLEACGLRDHELVVNSVGDAACRPAYVETLRAALREQLGTLGADSQRRTETSPLRVLDSKAPGEQQLIGTLPRLADHLCAACSEHFAEVRRELELLGIRYRVDHRLVRGLDYYTRTTFEVTSAALGAQNSVLGGGRYDGLVKELGGPDLTGIGFALGLERLVMILPKAEAASRCDVYLAPLAAAGRDKAVLLQRQLRAAGLSVLVDYEGRGLKSQMKRADKLQARFVALIGEDELAKGLWSVRDMARSAQESVEDQHIASYLEEKLNG